jgi:hypothetical protein
LTQVTAAALSACSEAIGVYWGNATLVIPSPVFNDFAVEMLPESFPIPIWIDMRVGTNEQNVTSGFTSGMEALGHMEFETNNASDSVGGLRERLFGLAAYVLKTGQSSRMATRSARTAMNESMSFILVPNSATKAKLCDLIISKPAAQSRGGNSGDEEAACGFVKKRLFFVKHASQFLDRRYTPLPPTDGLDRRSRILIFQALFSRVARPQFPRQSS